MTFVAGQLYWVPELILGFVILNRHSSNNDCFSFTEIKNKVKKCDKTSSDGTVGRVYPLDLWCLLGEYLNPEDIGRFAAICKGTHLIISTAKFWNNLYKRHVNFYNKVDCLNSNIIIFILNCTLI